MHLVLVTILALGASPASAQTRQPGAVEPAPAYAEAMPCEGCDDEACCCRNRGAALGAGNAAHNRALRAAMPQTCYQPRYGCYSGSERFMNRYPAFHGTYYRRPYNYRNLFDYPWHAEMHEPTSLFSYNVANQESNEAERLPPMARRPQTAVKPVPRTTPVQRPIETGAANPEAPPMPTPGAVRAAAAFNPSTIDNDAMPTVSPIAKMQSQPTLAPVTSRNHQSTLAPVRESAPVLSRSQYLSQNPGSR